MLLAARVAAERSDVSLALAPSWVRSVAMPLSWAVMLACAACAESSSSAVFAPTILPIAPPMLSIRLVRSDRIFAHTTALEPAGSTVGAVQRAGVDPDEEHPATAPTATIATAVNTMLRSIGRLPRHTPHAPARGGESQCMRVTPSPPRHTLA